MERWQKFLVEGNVIDQAFNYEDIVDPRALGYVSYAL